MYLKCIPNLYTRGSWLPYLPDTKLQKYFIDAIVLPQLDRLELINLRLKGNYP